MGRTITTSTNIMFIKVGVQRLYDSEVLKFIAFTNRQNVTDIEYETTGK